MNALRDLLLSKYTAPEIRSPALSGIQMIDNIFCAIMLTEDSNRSSLSASNVSTASPDWRTDFTTDDDAANSSLAFLELKFFKQTTV